MKTIKINPQNPDESIIQQAAKAIQNGQVVVFPCDTSYGLAADYLNSDALKKVFSIKGRDLSKELSVIVKDVAYLEQTCQLDANKLNYLNKYLPGAVTFILPLKQPINNLSTLGARLPGIPITDMLSNYLENPYTATSANPSGQPPAHTSEEIRQYFANQLVKPDLFLDAGDIPNQPSSTVVDLTADTPKILRQGLVKIP